MTVGGSAEAVAGVGVFRRDMVEPEGESFIIVSSTDGAGYYYRAMLLLMQPQYASRARHGYVRGTEPVHYVQTIRDRYRAYQLSAP